MEEPRRRPHEGQSYKCEVNDDLVPQILDGIRVGAMTITQVVAALDRACGWREANGPVA